MEWIFGMGITRDRTNRIIHLSQRAYIESLLKKFGLENALSVSTPFVQGTILMKDMAPSNEGEIQDMANIPYCMLVGSLMYLHVAICPDIAFHVGILSKFLINPGRPHWEVAK